MENPEIVLLFGAGASSGSGGTNSIPPLGDKLFEELTKNFPNTWGAKITGDLKKTFENKPFEEGMQSLYENPMGLANDVVFLLHDMSIYFSRFAIINDRNLYLKLIKRFSVEFKNRRIIIATLNYDCLVDNALISMGLQVDFDGKSTGARLLKLHGSCNFIPLNFNVGGPNLTWKIGQSTIIAPVKIIHSYTVEKELADTQLFAAMSLYISTKKNIFLPNFFKTNMEQYSQFIQNAKCIFSIGVKPDVDKHIWDPLKTTKAKVYLVGKGSETKNEYKNWIDKQVNKKSEHLYGHFEDKFNHIRSLIANELSSSN